MANPADLGNVQDSNAARLAKSGKQGERTDPTVIDHIAEQVFRNPRIKSAQLYQAMADEQRWAPLLPNARAFRGHVTAAKDRLDNGHWSPADAGDEEAALVLPVLGRIMAGRQTDFWLDPRVAGWVARIRRWLPAVEVTDETAQSFFILAVYYADRSEREAPTYDLDALIAGWIASGRSPY